MKTQLLVIVGPTAVGKTALSIELAKQIHGEILSGDSMQVYREMDIGTAKASMEERMEIPHHLIDMIDPDHPFSVQDFQQLARKTITDIVSRNHFPILVGGTGLYIESVIHSYQMPHVEEDLSLRQELNEYAEKHGNEALHRRLYEVDPASAVKLHPNDRRRIIRAMEVYQVTGKPLSELKGKKESPYTPLWIGLTMPRDQLYERINRRVDAMIELGLIDEVKRLKERGYHRGLTSMQAIGYKEIMSYLQGEISLEQAIDMIKQGTRKYAKRQLSWFRRLQEIHWFDVTKDGSFAEIQRLVAGKFQA
ncbi:tRNA (adenosine(37)-N6)-dimethylallyltransferase MiaA [Hazenella coriacea]|uniref:tRNA dimethylallyltransferase n=1 Tax=Hazenella coriacea TaxID=1179467 RepID=A0A4R3L4B8_9BACL|nr:tRNA dimethylallyltransferase [Hazenella coriacea]